MLHNFGNLTQKRPIYPPPPTTLLWVGETEPIPVNLELNTSQRGRHNTNWCQALREGDNRSKDDLRNEMVRIHAKAYKNIVFFY